MAEETYLSWNVANWITVILMALVGFALAGLAVKFVTNKRQQNATA